MHAPIQGPQTAVSLLVDGPKGGQQTDVTTARRLRLHLSSKNIQRVKDGADEGANDGARDEVSQQFAEEYPLQQVGQV